jgi:hypothetical protein
VGAETAAAALRAVGRVIRDELLVARLGGTVPIKHQYELMFSSTVARLTCRHGIKAVGAVVVVQLVAGVRWWWWW